MSLTRIKDRRELTEYLRQAIADYKSQESDSELSADIHISIDLGRVTIKIIEDE